MANIETEKERKVQSQALESQTWYILIIRVPEKHYLSENFILEFLIK